MLFERATDRSHSFALDDRASRPRTWEELADRVTRVARWLREDAGLHPDEHAALLMGNRAEFVEIVLGAMLAGIWLTPINRHLQADEIAYVLEDCGARVVFADAERAALARAPGAEVLTVGDAFESALRDARDEPMPMEGPAGATMIYTSGTTGRPKGVKRVRAANVGAMVEGAVRAGRGLGLDGGGPHLVTGPLYHAAPLLFAVYDLLAGAPMVIMPRFDADETLSLVAERGVRHTHLVPTMFVRLLALEDDRRAEADVSSLSLVLHGAAPIAPHVKERMIAWWGNVLVEYWGATEGGVCTLVESEDWLAHRGTVGRPTAAFEVYAVDDDGRRLGADQTGVLYCRHRQLEHPFEYHRDTTKTAAAYLGPAFTTGDIGRVDVDGYVYLSDRKSNMIISGGVNVYPAEVEQALAAHPAIADVGVFGIPDEEWGESVKAAVELRDGFEAGAELEADILAFARDRLAAYKVPRSIDFEQRLPRHATGKLYTRLLRDRYWKDRGRSI